MLMVEPMMSWPTPEAKRFTRVEFKARVLRDVSKIDLTADIVGQKSALPIILRQPDTPE